jgi:6-phosphogluconolactonase (cycloisomerase 2 family)
VLGISGFAIDPTSGAIAALPTALVTTETQLTAVGMALNHDSSGKHLYNSAVWGPTPIHSTRNQDDIFSFGIDPGTGALTTVGTVSINPARPTVTSLLMSPNSNYAYAQQTGSILTADPSTGVLTDTGNTAAWGTTSSPHGNPYGACAIISSGAFAYCTSAPSTNSIPTQGVVTQFGIDANTGAATPIATVAAGAFPQQITITPNGKFAYVADGANIWAYAIDPTSGALSPLAANPVAAPQVIRQFAAAPNGVGLYAVLPGSLIGYGIDPVSGALTQLSGEITVPLAQALIIDPTGKFLYVSGNPNLIYAESIDAKTGALTSVAGSPFNAAVPGVSYNSDAAVALDIVPVLP